MSACCIGKTVVKSCKIWDVYARNRKLIVDSDFISQGLVRGLYLSDFADFFFVCV